jgi:hypothetical protein
VLKTSFYGVQNNGTFVFDIQGQAAVLRKDNKYKKEPPQPLSAVSKLVPTVRIVYYNDLGTTVATNSGYGFKELIEV